MYPMSELPRLYSTVDGLADVRPGIGSIYMSNAVMPSKPKSDTCSYRFGRASGFKRHTEIPRPLKQADHSPRAG
jgi:hypothetical protein